jgi:hypothetical protein
MSFGVRPALLIVAGAFGSAAIGASSLLIWRHQTNMTSYTIQSKIVGIIWMVPIYCVDSFLGLLIPSIALYIDMLRDCYEVSLKPPVIFHEHLLRNLIMSILIILGVCAISLPVADAVLSRL